MAHLPWKVSYDVTPFLVSHDVSRHVSPDVTPSLDGVTRWTTMMAVSDAARTRQYHILDYHCQHRINDKKLLLDGCQHVNVAVLSMSFSLCSGGTEKQLLGDYNAQLVMGGPRYTDLTQCYCLGQVCMIKAIIG